MVVKIFLERVWNIFPFKHIEWVNYSFKFYHGKYIYNNADMTQCTSTSCVWDIIWCRYDVLSNHNCRSTWRQTGESWGIFLFNKEEKRAWVRRGRVMYISQTIERFIPICIKYKGVNSVLCMYVGEVEGKCRVDMYLGTRAWKRYFSLFLERAGNQCCV